MQLYILMWSDIHYLSSSHVYHNKRLPSGIEQDHGSNVYVSLFFGWGFTYLVVEGGWGSVTYFAMALDIFSLIHVIRYLL